MHVPAQQVCKLLISHCSCVVAAIIVRRARMDLPSPCDSDTESIGSESAHVTGQPSFMQVARATASARVASLPLLPVDPPAAVLPVPVGSAIPLAPTVPAGSLLEAMDRDSQGSQEALVVRVAASGPKKAMPWLGPTEDRKASHHHALCSHMRDCKMRYMVTRLLEGAQKQAGQMVQAMERAGGSLVKRIRYKVKKYLQIKYHHIATYNACIIQSRSYCFLTLSIVFRLNRVCV